MACKDRQLLVFVLSRSGCLAYAHEMIRHLSGFDLQVFSSAYAVAVMPVPHRRILTYRNVLEFVFNSLWMAPVLLMHLLKAWRRGCRAAYFPVFHPWNLFLQMFCRLLGIRSIVTIHDGVLHAGENHPLLQWWESACVRWADELIFLSRYVETTTRHKTGFSAKAHVIPHGCLGTGMEFSDRSLPASPRLLFIGRIVRYKGVELLIDAVEDLPDNSWSHLTIAGLVVNPLETRGRVDKVHWITGWLPEEEMVRLLRAHDILVLPYIEASQSGVLTLGIQAAIPMVCTRVGGLPEQLSESEAVWVEPNIADIRRGILTLISNREIYRQIHLALAKRREQAGWEESAGRLAGIIRAV